MNIVPPNITLIPVPLGPFTNPTGHYDIVCDCTRGCCSWVEPAPDCKECNGVGRKRGEYVPCQRESSEDDRITSDVLYLACHKDFWQVGHFHKAWYGWVLGNTQLDFIEFLYEVIVEGE